MRAATGDSGRVTTAPVVGLGSARSIADAIVATVADQRRAEASRLALICDLAEAYRPDGCADLPGRPRMVPLGDDGTPALNEFVPLELAGLLEVSPDEAGIWVRDAVNLRYRHPHLAAAVAALRIDVWQARRVVRECQGLSLPLALEADARLAAAYGVLCWARLRRKLRALVVKLDARAARERAATARRERFVRLDHAGDGTSWLTARLDTDAAVRLFDTIRQIAAGRVLDPGFAGTQGEAMADAWGELATPSPAVPAPAASASVASGAGRGSWPGQGTAGCGRATLVVHLHQETLADWTDDPFEEVSSGVARPEGRDRAAEIGAMLQEQVELLLGHRHVSVLPVVDLNGDPGVDSYEIPERVRRHVEMRDGYSVFPYSRREARACQQDHTREYRDGGPPQQTRGSNLGSLETRAHRAKTHVDGWRTRQPVQGTFEWTTPLGYRYWVDRSGTRLSPEWVEREDRRRRRETDMRARKAEFASRPGQAHPTSTDVPRQTAPPPHPMLMGGRWGTSFGRRRGATRGQERLLPDPRRTRGDGRDACASLSGMQISSKSVGPYDNNAYLLSDGDDLVLVDAAQEASTLLDWIGGRPLSTIVTTHRHPDHIAALAEVARATGARLVTSKPDADAISSATGTVQEGLWDGDTVRVGSVELEVIGLVGHTPGGIALAYTPANAPATVITGDCLFPGGVGKTHTPEQFASLFGDVKTKIFDRFGDDTAILPGHGKPTTLGVERPRLPEWEARGW